MLKNLLEDVKNKIFRIRAVSVFLTAAPGKKAGLNVSGRLSLLLRNVSHAHDYDLQDTYFIIPMFMLPMFMIRCLIIM